MMAIGMLTRNAAQGDKEALGQLRRGLAFIKPPATSEEELLTQADLYLAKEIGEVLMNVRPFIVPESILGGAHGVFRGLEATPTPFPFAYWRLAQLLSMTSPLLLCANPGCGKYFERRDPRQQYCSTACSNRMRQRRARETRRPG